MKKQDWIWMPHAAHFIGSQRCMFRLATCVGDYIVSTVGDYYPEHTPYEKEQIGYNRFYETFVFKAKKNPEYKKCGCEFVPSEFSEIDALGANTGKDAFENHMKLCEKWSKR